MNDTNSVREPGYKRKETCSRLPTCGDYVLNNFGAI